MPTNYEGAAAWCEWVFVERSLVESWDDSAVKERALAELAVNETHATLALRAVRAFAALASGRVRPPTMTPMSKRIGDDFAWCVSLGDGRYIYAPDPLDAITQALEASDAT